MTMTAIRCTCRCSVKVKYEIILYVQSQADKLTESIDAHITSREVDFYVSLMILYVRASILKKKTISVQCKLPDIQ